MSDIVICDGSNLFVRAFYSMTDQALQNSKAQDTTAIYVFLQHLRKLIDVEKPEECYVIFDFGRDVRKSSLYSDYKANRNIDLSSLSGYDLTVKMNEIESRKRQKNVIIEALKCLPVKLIIVKQIEGDALIAFAARHFLDREKTVAIVSNDKDFYQLLDDERLKIFNPHKKEYIAKCNMGEIFPIKNFPVSCYRLYKAIRGDSSDNVKGIHLFGDKKIQQLFDMFRECDPGKMPPKTIDELYADFETCPVAKKKFFKYFDGQRELLERNWKLIDLIDMEWSPQSLKIIYDSIESKPSFSKMDLMQILIKENINSIFQNIEKWVEPFDKMLPVKS